MYVPVASELIVVVVPVPVVVTPPGVLVNIHVPDDGKLFNTTLPVGSVHVGRVIVPTVGGDCTGCALITTLADAAEVHPVAVSVTVKLCVVDSVNPVIVVVVPVPTIAPGLIVHAPEGNPLNTTLPVDIVQVG